MVQPDMFAHDPSTPEGWVAPEIPTHNGEPRIILNAETDGLRWYHEDRPVGWAYHYPESGRFGYLPIRHVAGNLPIERVHDWLRDVRDMHVDNANTKFDLHMSRADGVDLVDDTGNTFGDVMHQAALLDDNRRRLALDELSADYLHWNVRDPADPLGKLPRQITSEVQFKDLHAGYVAPYAIRNVHQVAMLLDVFRPALHLEGLERVLDLEQKIIPVVVEMEKNGTWLDLELLHGWLRRVRDRLDEIRWIIRRDTGVPFTSFDAPKQLVQLFQKLNLPIVETEQGNPSFTGAILKACHHPTIDLVIEGGQLTDLESKYLVKYAKAARHDGWIRFNLHQLKSVRDSNNPDDKVGTISGRFSAAGDRVAADGTGAGGYNPQQAVAVEKQLERGWCTDYVVRKLFVRGPEVRDLPNSCVVASDMMQVEYRLFASYADCADAFHAPPEFYLDKGKKVYTAGPLADFHALAAKTLNKPFLNRKLVKNVNFAKIYGAGLIKFAFMIGEITEVQYKDLRKRQERGERVRYAPELARAVEVNADYLRAFPAVGPLLEDAKSRAKHRGYVQDFLGRRARIIHERKLNSALNRIIQGGAASYNKLVLIAVNEVRKQLGLVLRLTMHDELMADMHDKAMVPELDKVLNHQYFNFKAPILWDTKTGNSWADCK